MKDIKQAIKWVSRLEKQVNAFCDEFENGCIDGCAFYVKGDCVLYKLDVAGAKKALLKELERREVQK